MFTTKKDGPAVRCSDFAEITEEPVRGFLGTPAGVRFSVRLRRDLYAIEQYDRSLAAIMDYYSPVFIRYTPTP